MKDELIITGLTAHAMVIDGEQDPLHCTFENVGVVQIDTVLWDYILLTRENLETLLRLMDEADEYYCEFEILNQKINDGEGRNND